MRDAEKADYIDHPVTREINRARPRAPILENKHYSDPSVFTAENMLREARRQKGLAAEQVPAICLLDPDGDLVDYLNTSGHAQPHSTWACYHTTLNTFRHEGLEFGVVGRVVGAPFAVLVAEELFACGCQVLVSITSAGQISLDGQPPYVVLIERALRDEGTSYHYLPPAPYSYLSRDWKEAITSVWDSSQLSLRVGASWTTDAPFRETGPAIAAAREEGILAVEMEAAALYALASAKELPVVCFAHVTNQMAQAEGDFEKGLDNGNSRLLTVLIQVVKAWQTLE